MASPHLVSVARDAALVVLIGLALWNLADQHRAPHRPTAPVAPAPVTTGPALPSTNGLPLGVRRTVDIEPVFSLPQTFDVDGLRPPRLARCPGSITAADGLGPSARFPATLRLGVDADVQLQLDDTRVGSLRAWLLSQPHTWQSIDGPDPLAQPCLSWPQHDVPWRRQGMLPADDSVVCSSDVIGNSCPWRTDWSLVACHPTLPLCACPSKVAYGAVVETLYVHGPADDTAKTLLLDTLSPSLCLATDAAADAILADTTWTLQRQTVACTTRTIDSYCDGSTRRRVRQALWDTGRAWPPASYLPALRSAFSARTGLRIHVDSTGCQGGHGWVSAVTRDAGNLRLTVQCFWKASLLFQVLPSELVDGSSLQWHLHGSALTLKPEGEGSSVLPTLSNWCLTPLDHLRLCSDFTRVMTWISSSGIAEATVASVDAIVDSGTQALPTLSLVLDDWY